MEFALTDGTTTISLVYNPGTQTAYRLKYGAKIGAVEATPTWHNGDDAAPRLVSLLNGNRSAFFSLYVDDGGTDETISAMTTLRRWIDGDAQQAALATITGTVKPIFLKITLDTVTTLHRVLYGFIDDSDSYYGAISMINQIAENIVIYLTLAPVGQAESPISLSNYLKNPNFDFESATSGLASNWTKSGSPTVTLDPIRLFGVQSTKIVAGSANIGIYSNTVANTAETAAFCYVWLYILAGTAQVQLYDVTGAAVLDSTTIDATDSGHNSDMSRLDSSERRWWRVSASSASITAGNDVSIRIYSSGGAATFYAQGACLVLGESAVPASAAWCSYRAIYGRNDQTTTNPGYINTFDIWGVEGDAPALLNLHVTPDAVRNLNVCTWHDGRLNASELVHWYDENLSVAAAFGSVTHPSDAGRSGGAYWRVTTAVDDAVTVDVLADTASIAREYYRLPHTVFIIARASDVSKVVFTDPNNLDEVALRANNTWELLRVYTSGGITVNEASTNVGMSLLGATITTSSSVTVDIDCVVIQYVEQNIVIAPIGASEHIISGDNQLVYLSSGTAPLTHLGGLWNVYPGTLNRFMFLSWSTNYAHTLGDGFIVEAEILPLTRHLLGTI